MQVLLVVVLGLRSVMAVHERSGSFHPSKHQGTVICRWPSTTLGLCQPGLHTGVSSATFFKSPAASKEWWGSSEPSASRIFRRTF